VPAEFLRYPLELALQVRQRLALDVLHDKIGVGLAVRDELVTVQRAHDVVVTHALADVRLAQEPLEEPRLLEQVGMDDLQCDDTVGPGRGVDLAHTTGTELTVDAVGAEGGAWIHAGQGSEFVS